jgi:hypothetical protein
MSALCHERTHALQQTRRGSYEAVLEIQETEPSAGRLSHLVIKLAFVARLRRRAATKSRNARVLNGSRPSPRWTRLTANAPGSYLASTIFSLLSACPFRKSYPRVAMMQPRQDGRSGNVSVSLDRATQRRILVQR